MKKNEPFTVEGFRETYIELLNKKLQSISKFLSAEYDQQTIMHLDLVDMENPKDEFCKGLLDKANKIGKKLNYVNICQAYSGAGYPYIDFTLGDSKDIDKIGSDMQVFMNELNV